MRNETKSILFKLDWCLFVCMFVRIVLEYSGNRNSDFKNVKYLCIYGVNQESKQLNRT